MNTSTNESPIQAHQQSSPPHSAPEPPESVVADKVSFVKKYRWPLIATGLLAGGLTVALMAGAAKPATKDPRLQSPRVEVFEAQPAGSNTRTFTGIVEA